MISEDILVRFANAEDFENIPALREDAFLSNARHAAYRAHVVIAEEAADFRGYLLFGLYKDAIPFMHKLYVAPAHRSKGYAGEIIGKWEALMQEDGYKRVMLTTSSLNTAQNFYRLMGYRDIGSLTLPGEALEMVFLKEFIQA
ncbi:MAG: GNAT family N-acetyltransferase [Clostridia bacterium]|nr:GNAT family N-acetyltransferase [Clostridia bacterium]